MLWWSNLDCKKNVNGLLNGFSKVQWLNSLFANLVQLSGSQCDLINS